MKFKIRKKVLSESIKKVKKANATSTMPILKGILIETCIGNKIKLVGSDLELGIEDVVEAESIEEEGKIVIEGDYFNKIIKEMPKGILTITSKNNHIEITVDDSETELSFAINGMPADEFPELPKIEINNKLSVEADKFRELINKVIISISDDPSRPFLTGALFSFKDNKIEFASTDSYRLTYLSKKIENKEVEIEDVIIPKKTLDNIYKLLKNSEKDLEINIGNNNILFKIENTTLISRIIEGEFPNIKNIVPNKSKTMIKVNKKALLETSKRASLLAKENANIVNISNDDTSLFQSLKFYSNSDEIGTSVEHLEVIEMEGEDIDISFNINYLLDFLKTTSAKEITLEFNDSLSPLKITLNNKDYAYIIMPVRRA